DQVEAMTMGDRVAVLKDGYLQQVDTPQNLYDHPTNVFVAAFIGSPSMNLYDSTVTMSDGTGSVEIGSQKVAIASELLAKFPSLPNYDGKRVIVGIRPEDFEDAVIEKETPADRRITGNVKLVEALGSELMVHFVIDAKTVKSGDPDAPEQELGEGIANAVGRFDPRSRIRPDEDIEIAVSTENLHFFDPDTRERIR
ncbi:MAG: ABC transporter ATP-binding protein, partial [Actinomycetota bacterium]|nr:ABC transporter ATP-binding protein [Actinomycetota bacterium]